MPRPVKWRRVKHIPNIKYFKPAGIPASQLDEQVLKIEEIEAMRLKDVEGLEQEECARHMEVSRQTFQRILNNARKKVAECLVKGKAIRIAGGNFTLNICKLRCNDCETEWNESYERISSVKTMKCSYCGSTDIVCSIKGDTTCITGCRRNRNRHGRRF